MVKASELAVDVDASANEMAEEIFGDLARARTFDASYMNIDFIPTTEKITIQFTCASDEFPEYSNSIYNDAVGICVNGEDVPTVFGGDNASVNIVNQANNIKLFNSNVERKYNTEMDGFTVTFTLTMTVVPGEVYSIEIGIAETSDTQYDSSILIAGVTDTGYVTVSTIPFFVAGTGILTPDGEVRLETFQPGDLVVTQVKGAQPVRWIGRREVPARRGMDPIHVREKTFEDLGNPMVSRRHRVLVRDSLTELLFGDTEVLISAKDLVNDDTVTRIEGETVEYVHILFYTHEEVFCTVLATERFLPRQQMVQNFARDIIDEICALCPEMDPDTGIGYSFSARRTQRGSEAQLLFSGQVAA